MVAKFLVMVAFTLSNLTYLVTPGKEFNCSRLQSEQGYKTAQQYVLFVFYS